ncbi:hypothetical protein [Streptomyces sp. t39]|uniref:hypothetical protein n=1 Tax=Streptomyces sp. t39 TaxID=1828156 RepID=UPI001650B607|nr:hypothetical protein [Streptomyces sp. t39]
MPRTIWTTPWQPGPAGGTTDATGTGQVLVSVTEFVAHRRADTLPVALAGLRLRRTWPRTTGSAGMWLWLDPHPVRPRSGSVSVWWTAQDLLAFVARPDHRRIVRTHRDRGLLRSATWTEAGPRCHGEILESALGLLRGTRPWPGHDDARPGPNQAFKDHLDGLIDRRLLPDTDPGPSRRTGRRSAERSTHGHA